MDQIIKDILGNQYFQFLAVLSGFATTLWWIWKFISSAYLKFFPKIWHSIDEKLTETAKNNNNNIITSASYPIKYISQLIKMIKNIIILIIIAVLITYVGVKDGVITYGLSINGFAGYLIVPLWIIVGASARNFFDFVDSVSVEHTRIQTIAKTEPLERL